LKEYQYLHHQQDYVLREVTAPQAPHVLFYVTQDNIVVEKDCLLPVVYVKKDIIVPQEPAVLFHQIILLVTYALKGITVLRDHRHLFHVT